MYWHTFNPWTQIAIRIICRNIFNSVLTNLQSLDTNCLAEWLWKNHNTQGTKLNTKITVQGMMLQIYLDNLCKKNGCHCFVAKYFQVETIWTKVDTIGCAILNLLGCATQSVSKKRSFGNLPFDNWIKCLFREIAEAIKGFTILINQIANTKPNCNSLVVKLFILKPFRQKGFFQL